MDGHRKWDMHSSQLNEREELRDAVAGFNSVFTRPVLFANPRYTHMPRDDYQNCSARLGSNADSMRAMVQVFGGQWG